MREPKKQAEMPGVPKAKPSRGKEPPALPPFQVVFEALRDGFLGTMALDDIAVVPDACAAQKECSFEADDCGLVADQQGPTWLRQNGAGGRGPPADHTLGTAAGTRCPRLSRPGRTSSRGRIGKGPAGSGAGGLPCLVLQVDCPWHGGSTELSRPW